MATGKSTVGKVIARRHGLVFVDTDHEVEQRSGKTVAQIFAEHGETHFRRLERDVLADVLTREAQVIATGGGTLLEDESADLLRQGDRVVCLTCSADAVVERTSHASHRPLLHKLDREGVEALVNDRRAAYDRFEQFDTTNVAPEQVAVAVASVALLGEACRYNMQAHRQSVVVFERGAAGSSTQMMDSVDGADQVMIVTDTNVWNSGVVDPILSILQRSEHRVDYVRLPAGEQSKNVRSLERLYTACLEQRLDRTAVVLGVGGGMVCDIAALLAATYLRGVRLVLVPTTLLAQVDAAIGGKAAIDLAGAKNMVGAFYPADMVIIDPDTLRSLCPDRLSEGLAEIVKIAMVRNAALFHVLEALPGSKALLDNTHIIRAAAVEKVRVVDQDPREEGIRALLNFGHTVGHAAETASKYTLSHGEAVSIGMIAETWLAEELGLCARGHVDALRGLLTRLGLPTSTACIGAESTMLSMQQDKKRVGGELRFALPQELGRGTIVSVGHSEVRRAVDYVLTGAA